MNTDTDQEPWLSEDDEIWFGLISELFREVDVCLLSDDEVLRYYRMFKGFEQRRREQEAKTAKRDALLAKRKGWAVIDGYKPAQSPPDPFEVEPYPDGQAEPDTGIEAA